jgi:poly(beta-D-mannuronate) lyase
MVRIIGKSLALPVLAWLGACTTVAIEPPMPAHLVPTAHAVPLVAYPGEVMLRAAPRKALLSMLPLDQRRRLCGSPEPEWPSHPVIRTVEVRPGGGPDSRSEPFALSVMQEAALLLGEEDATARMALLDQLDRWARGGALTEITVEAANSYYGLDRTLLPTIVAWSLARDTPGLAREQRERIDRWLRRLVRQRGELRPPQAAGDTTLRNNHYYLRASVSMAWGALTGDSAHFEEGIAAFDEALADMRADGSLPLETERGARALWYQRHAIASLVAIAEMAAVQGQDLYAREMEGRSLHRAIRFLLDGIADPRVVTAYAAVDHRPGIDQDPSYQDLSFLTRRGHGRHYMAWAEPYMARFPDRVESRRLHALLTEADPHFRPMLDDYSGGNMSCFFAPPIGEGALEAWKETGPLPDPSHEFAH